MGPDVTADFVPLRREPKQHELKTWSYYFERILDGTKTFEIRRNDRDFRVGDVLWLRESVEGRAGFTGRSLQKRVVFMYRYDEDDVALQFLTEDVVVMGLAPMHSIVGHQHPAYVEAAAKAVSDANAEPTT